MKNEEKSNIIADTQLSKGFVFLQRQARSAEKTIGRCIHGTLTSNSLHSVPGGCVAFELHCFGSTKFHQLYFEDNIHSFFYRWSIHFILPCNNLFFIHFVNSFSCVRLDRSIKRGNLRFSRHNLLYSMHCRGRRPGSGWPIRLCNDYRWV